MNDGVIIASAIREALMVLDENGDKGNATAGLVAIAQAIEKLADTIDHCFGQITPEAPIDTTVKMGTPWNDNKPDLDRAGGEADPLF